MNIRDLSNYLALTFACLGIQMIPAVAREITFCGEQVPINNVFVAEKLMDVIRSQIPYVNLPELRRKADKYFPLIEYYLKATNLPADLKYIPIVESGFRNATSKVGAQGFWQLMEPTAVEWGLKVNAYNDDRNDIYKSTLAACKELARLYKSIRRDYRISSWVLSAAAYNYGIGNLYGRMNRQGNDYFSMNLNPETAVYVYKIIAIKELFEYPELYMKNFQYNVFNNTLPGLKKKQQDQHQKDTTVFKTLELKVTENDGIHPKDVTINNIPQPKESDLKSSEMSLRKAKLVGAQVTGKYINFKDGDSVIIKLQENIQTRNIFQRGGSFIAGRGWIIGERVFVDLGFESNDVILYDSKSQQGIPLDALRDQEQLILRILN